MGEGCCAGEIAGLIGDLECAQGWFEANRWKAGDGSRAAGRGNRGIDCDEKPEAVVAALRRAKARNAIVENMTAESNSGVGLALMAMAKVVVIVLPDRCRQPLQPCPRLPEPRFFFRATPKDALSWAHREALKAYFVIFKT
jgi:hypothetical protein